MHKDILWLMFVLLCLYYSLVFCKASAIEKLESKNLNHLLNKDYTALEDVTRANKKHYLLYSLSGFYGLALAYLLKIKIAALVLFVGSAIYLGFRNLKSGKCLIGETYKEGDIILDHPPSFAHHDHVPYTWAHDNNYDSGSFSSSDSMPFEPYSAYSGHSAKGSDSTDSSYRSTSDIIADIPVKNSSHEEHMFRRKRSAPGDARNSQQITGTGTGTVTNTIANLARQIVLNEEGIGEFMLNFLGLDTNACRRRFICEMEFKSRKNPLTSMAFRIVGHSFFAKYANRKNPLRTATTFGECATVNAECVFIENNEEMEKETMHQETQLDEGAEEEEEEEYQNLATDEATTNESPLEINNVIEEENDNNLEAEMKRSPFRNRLRRNRLLKFPQKA